MELIQSRNAATLLPIIQAHVQSNTTNHSDKLAAYRRVHQLPNVYRHQVNHSLHFVDPRTGVHIESYWSRVKRKFKRMKRVHLHQMPVERAVWNYSIHGIDKHHPRHRRTVSCIRLALYHRYLTSAAYYINISWYPPFDLSIYISDSPHLHVHYILQINSYQRSTWRDYCTASSLRARL